MIKLIEPGSQDFREPSVQMVKMSNRGLVGNDLRSFVKRAGHRVADVLQQIKWAKGEMPVHLIAIGATEDYGPNRNGDGFTRDTCREHHHTFKKHARFYRDHQNKDPRKSYGIVKASLWNDAMKRIELICGLNMDKEAAERNGGLVADRELQMLADGKNTPVSMACVLDPEYPVLVRDRGYVGISSVRVGDYVWTHKGRWRRVTQLNRRTYTGEVFTFEMNGLPLPLELTADHPMWAKVFDGSREVAAVKGKARRYFNDPAAFDAAPAGWLHASHVGVGDRYFYKPLTRYAGYGRVTDTDLSAVMGYYLAEGSFIYNGDKACSTQFNCNMTDSLPRRLPALIERMFADVTVDIAPRSHSDPALVLSLHSTEFSEFLRQYVGRGCKHKLIAPEIFNAVEDVKLAFLGAWLDGDGWCDKKGVHWSTSSLNLVLQGRDLLASIGVPASIYKIDHAACTTSGRPGSGVEYTINVSHLDAWRLAGWSEKAAAYPTPNLRRTKPATMRACPDGTYAYRVKAVHQRYVSDATTYNFEVEEDESYSLGGLISHNCKVAFDVCSGCGHKAAHRGEYCTSVDEGGQCKYGGLRHHIGQVMSDGHVLHADNPNPLFFDISKVFRPADRIAYVSGQLQKAAAAGHVVSGAELAEALGVTAPLELQVDSNIPRDVARQYKVAHVLAGLDRGEKRAAYATSFATAKHASQNMPVTPSDPRGGVKFAEFARALADERICLGVQDFVSLVTGRPHAECEKTAALVKTALPGAFERALGKPVGPVSIENNPYTPAPAAPHDLRMWAKKEAENLSFRRECVDRRVKLATIRQADVKVDVPDAGVVKTASEGGPAAELAHNYALYKIAFLAEMPEDEDLPLTASLCVLQNYC